MILKRYILGTTPAHRYYNLYLARSIDLKIYTLSHFHSMLENNKSEARVEFLYDHPIGALMVLKSINTFT